MSQEVKHTRPDAKKTDPVKMPTGTRNNQVVFTFTTPAHQPCDISGTGITCP
jgi:hypothetical protein